MIELLVVISIIGILVSLLLPAVQQMREAARRTQCKNNLKNLALAAINFESSYGYLPPGTDIQQTGPLVVLLPYLEQTAYYNGFSFDPNYVFWFKNPINRPPTQSSDWTQPQSPQAPPAPGGRYGAQGTIPGLMCPDLPPPDSFDTVLLLVLRGVPFVDFTPGPYGANYNVFCGIPGNQTMTRASYAAVGGDWYETPATPGKYRGIFNYSAGYSGPVPYGFPQAKGHRFADVTDGLSNTLMFGETGYTDIGPTSMGVSNPIHSTMSIATGQIYFTDGINDVGYGNTFGSLHTNVVHFALADGSVRGISNISVGAIGSSDPTDIASYGQVMNKGSLYLNLLRLGGISDGEATSGDY